MKEKAHLNVATTNWKNFFRQMIGLPKVFPVKIERTAKAQQYPLIDIKKEGDVGYDLPCIEDVTIIAPTAGQRARYEMYMQKANRLRQSCNGVMSKSDFDFYDQEIKRLEAEAMACLPHTVIPTGIKLEMPNNIWCTLCARSSTSNRLLITPDSIIDAGYRGEMFAVVFNLGYTDLHVKAGERLVQIIFHERTLAQMIEVDKVGTSQRGTSGFGSTGA